MDAEAPQEKIATALDMLVSSPSLNTVYLSLPDQKTPSSELTQTAARLCRKADSLEVAGNRCRRASLTSFSRRAKAKFSLPGSLGGFLDAVLSPSISST